MCWLQDSAGLAVKIFGEIINLKSYSSFKTEI